MVFLMFHFYQLGPASPSTDSSVLVCSVTRVLCIKQLHVPSVTHRISVYLSHSGLSAGGWLEDAAYLLAGFLPGLDDQPAPG